MRRIGWLLALLALVIFPVRAAAQDDCGNGLPCGPVPWDVPYLPTLESPTPFPTIFITPVPEVTDDPNPGEPTPTATDWNVTDLDDTAATIQAILEGTEEPIEDLQDTYSLDDIGDHMTLFFGYARSAFDLPFGVFQPLVLFLLFSMAVRLSFRVGVVVLPILAVIFGFVRKIVQLILDFIPF